MSDMCFANSTDSLYTIVQREYGDLDGSAFEERIRAIENLNPRLPTSGNIQPNQAILLPSDGLVLMPSSDEIKIIDHMNSISCEGRKVLAELCNEEQYKVFSAIADLFDEYDLWSLSGDLNTYGSAGIGNAVSRSTQLHKAIAAIDEALVELVNTPTGQRHQIKMRIKSLYRALHNQFGAEVNKIIARSYKGKKGHPLLSSKRGMNMALGGSRRLPLTSLNSAKNLTRFATAGKIAGKGLIILDLGLRYRSVNNEYQTGGNWRREAFAQTLGFGASFVAGGIAFSFLLGPAGVIVALILASAVAIGFDYFGKGVGYTLWDTGTYLQRYLQPPYVY